MDNREYQDDPLDDLTLEDLTIAQLRELRMLVDRIIYAKEIDAADEGYRRMINAGNN